MAATLQAGRRVAGRLIERVVDDRVAIPWLSFWARVLLAIRRPLIIGVTGSVGKTTTTRMIAAMLAHPASARIVGTVRSTEQNMNDDYGVPLVVLGFDEWLPAWWLYRLRALCSAPLRVLAALGSRYPAVLVLEYGTHWKGHLHRLVRIARPKIAVVTTVGPAHLERLRTLEGVMHEKSALVLAAPRSGLVVLGDDHAFVDALQARSAAPVVRVSGRGIELSRAIARAVGRHLGLPEAAIAETLAAFTPPVRRLERIVRGGMLVIDDSCNANPMSMKLGLEELDAAAAGRRRVALLGGMGELGDESARYHAEIAAFARERSDVLIGVGDLARAYRPDHWFESSESAAAGVQALLRADDCVLIKGSSAVGLYRVAEAFRNAPLPAAARGELQAAPSD